ncbi:MAG: hypothetical protein OEZ45_12295, partial [Candidatus Aminicenantes bacterium]|nr:hypothetical protein [Candidatus Aminicenantes bacterium]
MRIQSFKHGGLSFIPLLFFLLFTVQGFTLAAQKVPISFNDYHSCTQTVAYIEDVAKAYPNITALLEIGRSNMGRPI